MILLDWNPLIKTCFHVLTKDWLWSSRVNTPQKYFSAFSCNFKAVIFISSKA